jgi:hypothetical protein
VDATLDQTGPHAPVDASCTGTADDKGPERTGWGRQFRSIALERDDRNLKAEPAERITNSLESGRDVSGRLQSGRGGEPAAEFFACLAERLWPAASRNSLDQQADQFGQAPVGELDSVEFGRDAIDLGRTSGSRPSPSAGTLERDFQEACLGEPIEPAAGEVPVDLKFGRSVSGGERVAPASRVQEDPPKLRIAGRCKPIERHVQKPTRPRDVTGVGR